MRTPMVAVIWATLTLSGASGPESPLHKRISVDYWNLPLADAMKDLEGKTGAQIAAPADLLQNRDNVTYTAKEQEAGRILTQILRPHGLKLEKPEGNRITVARLGPHDEFKVKREESFEFVQKPRVMRDDDRVTVSFETRAFCDVTVAIEGAQGTILRHLASGLLGENAPEPFQWNSKKQTLVWDGKDDQGAYVDDKDSVSVRVSLGLKPQFERTLYWEPRKRLGALRLSIRPAPEGVYVYDAGDLDQLRLFDHEGHYVRTIYPFAAEKLDKVTALEWQTCPQDGLRIPVRHGNFPASLLPASEAATDNTSSYRAASLAVGGDRIVLLGKFAIRLAKDGSTSGLPLVGPKCAFSTFHKRSSIGVPRMEDVAPIGAAIAPDGKTLYLTGYGWSNGYDGYPFEWLNGVVRMDLTEDTEPTVFAGAMKQTAGYHNEGGTEAGRFRVPVSVTCDRQGRVYVADHLNDRIQVFSPDGKVLKMVPVARPTSLELDPRTDEMWVFSWGLPTQQFDPSAPSAREGIKSRLVRLGALENPGPIAEYELPIVPRYSIVDEYQLPPFVAVLDFWATPPTIWLVNEYVSWAKDDHPVWEKAGIKVLTIKDKTLELKHDFGKETRQSVGLVRPPPAMHARLYVNPKNEKLYLSEGVPIEECAYFRAFVELAEIDPDTGKVRVVPLPFHSEDLCFDLNGCAYLRAQYHVVRYDPGNWREVPWDYGEESRKASWASGPVADVVSGLRLPGTGVGGFGVSAKGHLAVAHMSGKMGTLMTTESAAVFRQRAAEAMDKNAPKPYQARLYPGRAIGGRNVLVHVFDKHGKPVLEDAVRGLAFSSGVKIDRDDNLYVLNGDRGVIDGKAVFNSKQFQWTNTLIKFRPEGGRLASSSPSGVPVPMVKEAQPNRRPDIEGKWVEGAEWAYGGAGFRAFHSCFCATGRFDLDLFGRSFVPEWIRAKVAVLDTNGNLILRVGQLGNVDDGKPLVAEGGPPNARSIGGDEVALFWAVNVATHSDRRLFIHDWGNARIVSVKLGYHAEERISLKDVGDRDGI